MILIKIIIIMKSEPIPTKIIKIGDSQGITIPQTILDLSGIEDSAEMYVENGSIIIRPLRKIREGWSKSFAEMAATGDDKLIDNETVTEWDKQEWQWQ
jgi:antitoxin MazE